MLTKLFYEAIRDWRERTYPGSDLKDIALKLGEESGEVQGAVFKNRWSDADEQNIRDEVGDAALVLASVCQWMDWDLIEVLQERAVTKGMIDAGYQIQETSS